MISARVSVVPLVLAALVLAGITCGLGQRAEPRYGHRQDEVIVHELLAKHRQELLDLRLAILEALIAAQLAALDAELDRLERKAGRPRYICRYPLVPR